MPFFDPYRLDNQLIIPCYPKVDSIGYMYFIVFQYPRGYLKHINGDMVIGFGGEKMDSSLQDLGIQFSYRLV